MNPKTMTFYPRDYFRDYETRLGCLCAIQQDDGKVYIGWSAYAYKEEMGCNSPFKRQKPTLFNKKLARDMAMGRAKKGRTVAQLPDYLWPGVEHMITLACKRFSVQLEDIIVVTREVADVKE